MIKAIFFDLDGVLINSEIVSQGIYQDFINEYNLPIPLERFKRLIGSHKTWNPFAKVIEGIDINMSAQEFEELVVSYRNMRFASYDIGTLAFKDVKETLSYISSLGIKIAVASSSSIDYVNRMLQANNIDEYFDLKVTGDDFSRPKPEADIYLYCQNHFKINSEECLVIEDSPLGIKAGKNAKMKVIAKRDHHFDFDQSEADFYIDDLKELTKLLR